MWFDASRVTVAVIPSDVEEPLLLRVCFWVEML